MATNPPALLFEDLTEDPAAALPLSPIKQALIFVVGSLGFMALASLALWSGFQYEASRRREQPLLTPPLPAVVLPETTPVARAVIVGTPTKTLKAMPPAEIAAPVPEPIETVAVAPPLPPAPYVGADLPSAIRLVGVIADAGNNFQALLMVDNILLPLGAGEPIERGWYVASVQRERVVLSNGSHSHTLQLGLTGQL